MATSCEGVEWTCNGFAAPRSAALMIERAARAVCERQLFGVLVQLRLSGACSGCCALGAIPSRCLRTTYETLRSSRRSGVWPSTRQEEFGRRMNHEALPHQLTPASCCQGAVRAYPRHASVAAVIKGRAAIVKSPWWPLGEYFHEAEIAAQRFVLPAARGMASGPASSIPTLATLPCREAHGMSSSDVDSERKLPRKASLPFAAILSLPSALSRHPLRHSGRG